jgi:lauroyl/myristoyl acyltransferase
VSYVGGVMARALRTMKQHAGLVVVNVDPHWPANRGSTVTLPFAGFSKRTFSTGAARLARMADSPLLLLLPFPDRGKHVTAHLLGPYVSQLETPEERDADVTRQLLAEIERRVGEHPETYALDIGHERTWNSATLMWESNV